jgi:hypothetical protein
VWAMENYQCCCGEPCFVGAAISIDGNLPQIPRRGRRINALHGPQLCSRWQMSKLSFVSVYHVYSVSTENIFMWICEV